VIGHLRTSMAIRVREKKGKEQQLRSQIEGLKQPGAVRTGGERKRFSVVFTRTSVGRRTERGEAKETQKTNSHSPANHAVVETRERTRRGKKEWEDEWGRRGSRVEIKFRRRKAWRNGVRPTTQIREQ